MRNKGLVAIALCLIIFVFIIPLIASILAKQIFLINIESINNKLSKYADIKVTYNQGYIRSNALLEVTFNPSNKNLLKSMHIPMQLNLISKIDHLADINVLTTLQPSNYIQQNLSSNFYIKYNRGISKEMTNIAIPNLDFNLDFANYKVSSTPVNLTLDNQNSGFKVNPLKVDLITESMNFPSLYFTMNLNLDLNSKILNIESTVYSANNLNFIAEAPIQINSNLNLDTQTTFIIAKVPKFTFNKKNYLFSIDNSQSEINIHKNNMTINYNTPMLEYSDSNNKILLNAPKLEIIQDNNKLTAKLKAKEISFFDNFATSLKASMDNTQLDVNLIADDDFLNIDNKIDTKTIRLRDSNVNVENIATAKNQIENMVNIIYGQANLEELEQKPVYKVDLSVKPSEYFKQNLELHYGFPAPTIANFMQIETFKQKIINNIWSVEEHIDLPLANTAIDQLKNREYLIIRSNIEPTLTNNCVIAYIGPTETESAHTILIPVTGNCEIKNPKIPMLFDTGAANINLKHLSLLALVNAFKHQEFNLDDFNNIVAQGFSASIPYFTLAREQNAFNIKSSLKINPGFNKTSQLIHSNDKEAMFEFIDRIDFSLDSNMSSEFTKLDQVGLITNCLVLSFCTKDLDKINFKISTSGQNIVTNQGKENIKELLVQGIQFKATEKE